MLTIMTREMWRAHPPVVEYFMTVPAATVFYACTYTYACSGLAQCGSMLRTIQTVEKDYNKRDVIYNFIIGTNGVVYEGRGWRSKPGLPKQAEAFIDTSMYIGFVGKPADFEKDEQLRNTMKNVLTKIIDLGIKQNYIQPSYTLKQINRA